MLSNQSNLQFLPSPSQSLKPNTSYNWQGVMQFLHTQYQTNAQRQNIWAIQRNQLKETIQQLHGKVLALQNINKDLMVRNDMLECSLRQLKKSNNASAKVAKENEKDNLQQLQPQPPKIPQRRPKPNNAQLSKILSGLGIPELLKDIKEDLQRQQTNRPNTDNTTMFGQKSAIRAGLQLDLSKMQASSLSLSPTQQHQDNLLRDSLSKYEETCTLEGHQDGIRQVCFINGSCSNGQQRQLKQIVSVSEDCTMKVWKVTNNNTTDCCMVKGEELQTIRDHSGPIFTCVQGDGNLFTGGMQGVIRMYKSSNAQSVGQSSQSESSNPNSSQKFQLALKWRNNLEEKLEPLWQLAYDRINKILIATSSEMVIKGYKISEDMISQSFSPNSNSKQAKVQVSSHFIYKTSNEQIDEFIPTAICLHRQNLVASYFNSNSIVQYDCQTQKIVNEIGYAIDEQLSANKLVSHPRCLIGAYEDCNIRLFDDQKMVQCFKAHEEAAMSVSLSWTNPNALFSCGQDGYVKLWDMRRLQKSVWQKCSHQKKNDQAVHCIQTNSDGVTVSGGADSLLKIFCPKNV